MATPTTSTFTRGAAIDRAIDCVTRNPADLMADDGATVVHVTGRNPILGGHEDSYICLGGIHTQSDLDESYRPSGYTAALVMTIYREGETCAEAAARLL